MPTARAPKLTDNILPRTEQTITDAIYDCLESIHELFIVAGITYSLFGGSILGAVRSGGMIPWDDDADIVIRSKDATKVYDLRDRFAEKGFLMRDFPYGIKIFRPGQPSFPDIDVFMINDDYQYSQERARLRWPGDPLPYGSLDRVHLVPFGRLMLFSLSDIDARKLLEDTYGKYWSTTVDKTNDHLYNQPHEYRGLMLMDNSCARHSSHP